MMLPQGVLAWRTISSAARTILGSVNIGRHFHSDFHQSGCSFTMPVYVPIFLIQPELRMASLANPFFDILLMHHVSSHIPSPSIPLLYKLPWKPEYWVDIEALPKRAK